jgi:DNA-3-methyladenine glycosylase
MSSRPTDFLQGDVVEAAKRLLGCRLVCETGEGPVSGLIVETEAYHQTDAASHSYKGKTPRTEVMFGPAGRAYVYFTYGMHYCMNIVTGAEGEGSAVLIRALQPLTGMEHMRAKRPGIADTQLTNGPAKLCKALGIDRSYNGHDISRKPLRLIIDTPVLQSDITTATRIGISRDTDRPWRFYITDNTFVSKR